MPNQINNNVLTAHQLSKQLQSPNNLKSKPNYIWQSSLSTTWAAPRPSWECLDSDKWSGFQCRKF